MTNQIEVAQEADEKASTIKFMTLFAKLKDWSDDDPESLSDLAEKDEVIKDLCIQLCDVGRLMIMNTRRRRELFAAPVDPKFLEAWREFEERFFSRVGWIWIKDFHEREPTIEVEYANLLDGAKQARAIENAIVPYIDPDLGFPPDDDEVEGIAEAWEDLNNAGIDLQGIFRRRNLVPFVLIPRHVAAKYGNTEAISMLKHLQQAHEAFVFGTPFAALALMRAVMETVLRDHYGVEGPHLDDRINQARDNKRLPKRASADALHRLRDLANKILHLEPHTNKNSPKIESMQLEREIVGLLFVLRALIEGAPQRIRSA